jgi:hypothetical protein
MFEQQLTITAKTSDVLATLKTNRDRHTKIVAEARVGFAQKAKALLEEALKTVAQHNEHGLSLHLPAPVDHTQDYAVAIQMMEMHQSDLILMTQDQVKKYILDRWEWESHFVATNSTYAPSLGGKT